jgi:hypothetical protein
MNYDPYKYTYLCVEFGYFQYLKLWYMEIAYLYTS